MKLSGILTACAVSVLATAAVAAPQNPPPASSADAAAAAPAAAAGDATKGAATFDARCKMCHAAEGGAAPPPATLATFKPEDIRAALKTGPMVPMAAGLSDDDINNIVTFLTTKPAS